MLRKMMIALFACASVAMLAPDAAFARGGFGGGGGGFHGGGGMGMGGGGFRGGGMGMGGGFRGGGMGMGGGGFRAAAIGGGGFRAAAIGGGGFRAASAALPAAGFRGGTFAVNRFGGFRPGFRHHRRFPFAVTAIGLGFGYGYYDDYYDYGYPYYGDYYGDGGCYIVRRSVLTPYGWRFRPVQVCG
jgi:hypothetical protein